METIAKKSIVNLAAARKNIEDKKTKPFNNDVDDMVLKELEQEMLFIDGRIADDELATGICTKAFRNTSNASFKVKRVRNKFFLAVSSSCLCEHKPRPKMLKNKVLTDVNKHVIYAKGECKLCLRALERGDQLGGVYLLESQGTDPNVGSIIWVCRSHHDASVTGMNEEDDPLPKTEKYDGEDMKDEDLPKIDMKETNDTLEAIAHDGDQEAASDSGASVVMGTQAPRRSRGRISKWAVNNLSSSSEDEAGRINASQDMFGEDEDGAVEDTLAGGDGVVSESCSEEEAGTKMKEEEPKEKKQKKYKIK